jgi:hypothetical protein
MKRILAILLIAALAFSLTSCGVKEMVREKVREVLDAATGNSTSADGNSSGGVRSGGSGTTPGGDKRPIASVNNPGGYWNRLESEWENAPEEGYVWTITIDSVETLDMMGLLSVSYDLRLSCSHVGPDMFGPYKGEMEMSYNADLDAVMELLTITGGSATYDADGWFMNDRFIMELCENDAQAEGYFIESLQPASDMSSDEQAIVDSYMNQFLGNVGSGTEQFEFDQAPSGNWFDWEFKMTDGDMSGYLNVTNIAYGTTSGSGTVDASGVNTDGWATASHPLAGTFSERYSEKIETPFPYIIRVYETGQVVFELHSANGGPVTVKFYGAIDKIPVEDTTLVRPR